MTKARIQTWGYIILKRTVWTLRTEAKELNLQVVQRHELPGNQYVTLYVTGKRRDLITLDRKIFGAFVSWKRPL